MLSPSSRTYNLHRIGLEIKVRVKQGKVNIVQRKVVGISGNPVLKTLLQG